MLCCITVANFSHEINFHNKTVIQLHKHNNSANNVTYDNDIDRYFTQFCYHYVAMNKLQLQWLRYPSLFMTFISKTRIIKISIRCVISRFHTDTINIGNAYCSN